MLLLLLLALTTKNIICYKLLIIIDRCKLTLISLAPFIFLEVHNAHHRYYRLRTHKPHDRHAPRVPPTHVGQKIARGKRGYSNSSALVMSAAAYVVSLDYTILRDQKTLL